MSTVVNVEVMPHQYDLLEDTTTKILGLCSGYGGGKTWVAVRKAVQLMLLNPGCDGMITEPTHPLLTQVLYPELETALEEFGIRYKFNKVEKIFTCWVWDEKIQRNRKTRIICASMENYKRLIGVNAAWAVLDEFDTSAEDVAYMAFVKLLGRLRRGKVRQMIIVSTPEGFRAMYRIFVTELDEMKRLIKAKTRDNPHLPEDYIKTLEKQYSKELVEAYLNGEFVNMTAGIIYHTFDRKLNHTNAIIMPGDDLHVGMDFNLGNMSGIVHVLRNGEPRAVEELIGILDTPTMMQVIADRYLSDPDVYHRVIVYPDASGASGSTKGAAQSDIAIIEQAGHEVVVDLSNPAVKDRVNAMQAMFCNAAGKRRYKVNTLQCPKYTRTLEQQVWDENGQPDKKAGNDHTNDAGGYFIIKMFPIIDFNEHLVVGIRR